MHYNEAHNDGVDAPATCIDCRYRDEDVLPCAVEGCGVRFHAHHAAAICEFCKQPICDAHAMVIDDDVDVCAKCEPEARKLNPGCDDVELYV